MIEWLPGPGADAIPSVWFSAVCVLLCWPGRVGPDLEGEPNSQQSLNIKPAEMEFHHAGTGLNPTEPAGKKKPQTVLRFPVCKIEIVTRCSLTHSYTHSLQSVFLVCLFCWRPWHTPRLGNPGELHWRSIRKLSLCMVVVMMKHVCYSILPYTSWNQFHGRCCWRLTMLHSSCPVVLGLTLLWGFPFFWDSFGTFGPQLEHLFNTPYLEVNPPMMPL